MIRRRHRPLPIVGLLTVLTLMSGALAIVPTGECYAESADREILYLTLDRPCYREGDTVWFRGTLLQETNNSYLTRTNYIYVELLDARDSVVFRRKVKRDGLCFHHCVPLAGLPQGNYSLRAYTSWMRNFGADGFFSRRLQVTGPMATSARRGGVQPPADGGDDGTFAASLHAEGGRRLAGIGQRIAFRAVRGDGFPQEADGELLAADGTRLAALHSLHDGMGAIDLTAEANREGLTVRLWPRGDTARSVVLPLPAAEVGYALRTEPSHGDGSVTCRILRSGAASEGLQLSLYRGVRLRHRLPLADAQDSATIPPTAWSEGVHRLVLEDAAGAVLAERLISPPVALQQAVSVSLRPDTANRPQQARSLMTYTLAMHMPDGRPLRGDFAVSVLDPAGVDVHHDAGRDDIETWLRLTSALQGYVHAPRRYFDDSIPPSRRDTMTDLLLLTHPAVPSPAVGAPTPAGPAYPVEEYEALAGRIELLNGQERRGGIPVSARARVGGSFGSARTDSAGRFCITGLDYPDDTRVTVKALARSRRLRFAFDRPDFPAPSRREPFMPLPAADAFRPASLAAAKDAFRLPEVEVTHRVVNDPLMGKVRVHDARKSAFLREHYDLGRLNDARSLVSEVIKREWSRYLDPLDMLRDEDMAGEFDEYKPIKPKTVEAIPRASAAYLPSGTTKENYDKVQAQTPYPLRVPKALAGHYKPYVARPTVYVIDGKGITYEERHLDNLSSADIDSIVCVVGQRRLETLSLGDSVALNDPAFFIRPDVEAITDINLRLVQRSLYVYLRPEVTFRDAVRDWRTVAHYPFGYAQPAYFFDPTYPDGPDDTARPDLRKTLRWLPSLQTDERGEIPFQYYNSDHPGPRYVVVEGVTFDGQPVHYETVIE